MARFHSLSIKDIRRETKDCVSVAFEVPDALTSDFEFNPGQHLVLKTDIEGVEVRRSYSICSSPSENELRVAIKQIEGGVFSTYANTKLKKGDNLEVMPPTGNFGMEEGQKPGGSYIAFAAGSGITPIISIIKSTLETDPGSSFTLFYGNRTQQSIIFNEQLAFLKNEFLNRLSIYHVLSQENPGSDLFYGRIDEEKCRLFFNKLINPLTVDAYFLCGPVGMIDEVRACLKFSEVPAETIHFELFTAPDQKARKVETSPEASQDFNVAIDIKIDNESFRVESSASEGTILEIANNAGHDLPFSCMGGVCCTCRAKLTEGEAEMDVNYALEEDEVESGYILTCQARPKSQKIAVDFDA